MYLKNITMYMYIYIHVPFCDIVVIFFVSSLYYHIDYLKTSTRIIAEEPIPPNAFGVSKATIQYESS